MKPYNFSIVEKLKLTEKICNVDRLVKGLKEDKMKTFIEPIRKLIANDERDKANLLKAKLPAIIPAGIFKGERTKTGIQSYSHIICLDLDKLEPEMVAPIKEIIAKSDYTFLVFDSPSGRGLKIFVKVDSGMNYHKDAYNQVAKFYEQMTGRTFDHTHDITRLMYMSYDPEVYYYPDSVLFHVETPIQPFKPELQSSIKENEKVYQKKYDAAFNFTKKKIEYVEGNRNNFVHMLAAAGNRYGLPAVELSSRLQWCELPQVEVETTIKSAYKNKEDWNIWQLDFRNNNATQNDNNPSKILLDTDIFAPEINDMQIDRNIPPCISKEVYDLLPEFLKEITSKFPEGIDKDIVLISTLGVMSSIFPSTKGLYESSSVALNLYTLLVAPPGSGKGKMKWAARLTNKVENLLLEEHEIIVKRLKKAKDILGLKTLVERKINMGTDTSVIGLFKQMFVNKNFGIMFDSEGSTLTTMFKNDWSNFSNLLLKSLHNESHTITRSDRSITIEKTFLSIVLSSIPAQVFEMLKGVDNGLYSRFGIYYFSGEDEFKNLFGSKRDTLEEFFDNKADEVLKMWKANIEGNKTFVSLSEENQTEVYEYFCKSLQEFNLEYGGELAANVKRSCLIFYKIAMILTCIRGYGKTDTLPGEMIIDERDFRAAFLIVDTLLQHTKFVFENVINKKSNGMIGKKKQLAQTLPKDKFQRAQYLEIAAKLSITKATADFWLKDFQKKGIVSKLEHGLYQKAA